MGFKREEERPSPLPLPLWRGVVTTVNEMPTSRDKINGERKTANAITHFLTLRQGRVPRRGEGVDKLSALSCRNEVCDHSSASVKHIEINSALFA